MTVPKVHSVWKRNDYLRAMVECPGCGYLACIDKDQYEGKVSIDCPECDYHETHDFTLTAQQARETA